MAQRLFTEDGRVWMPINRDGTRAGVEHQFTREGADVNSVDEGKDTLGQLASEIKPSVDSTEGAPSRICRMVSNVQIMRTTPDGAPRHRPDFVVPLPVSRLPP